MRRTQAQKHVSHSLKRAKKNKPPADVPVCAELINVVFFPLLHVRCSGSLQRSTSGSSEEAAGGKTSAASAEHGRFFSPTQWGSALPPHSRLASARACGETPSEARAPMATSLTAGTSAHLARSGQSPAVRIDKYAHLIGEAFNPNV